MLRVVLLASFCLSHPEKQLACRLEMTHHSRYIRVLEQTLEEATSGGVTRQSLKCHWLHCWKCSSASQKEREHVDRKKGCNRDSAFVKFRAWAIERAMQDILLKSLNFKIQRLTF